MQEKTPIIINENEYGGLWFNQEAVDLPALLARLYNTAWNNHPVLSGQDAMTEDDASKLIKTIRKNKYSQHMVDYLKSRQIKLIFDDLRYSPDYMESLTGYRPKAYTAVAFIGHHKDNGETWAKDAIDFAMLPKKERAKILINECKPVSSNRSHSNNTSTPHQRS